MLFLGDNGILSAFNDFTISYEEPIICPKKVYRGEEAEKLIMDYCTETGDYAYFKAPDGQSWEVVEYDLNYKNCENDDYVNIKLKGMDGEPLRYRGIKYEARTYEMGHKAVEDGEWIRGLYVYYPVPNGCYEYCLECGERKSLTGEEVSAAYYHIINEEEVHSEQADEASEDASASEGSSTEEAAASSSSSEDAAESDASTDSSSEDSSAEASSESSAAGSSRDESSAEGSSAK